jgi:carbonic anhydrase/acetyltransferase-like protein (isoleucine patch superfamily)
MVVRPFDGVEPTIHETAYVDDAAVVVGDVTLERDASVWPNATLRGDSGAIVVGEGSNVQDGAVLHEDAVLDAGVTVGHNAIVHDARVESGALVGMGAIVLDGSVVGSEAIVAAGAVLTEGTEVPRRALVAGTPAEVRKTFESEPAWTAAADRYVTRSKKHAETAERLD